MTRSGKVLLTLVAAGICLAACSRNARIIPPKKMEQIYQDLLLADQWIDSDPSYEALADSTLFYESIFNKYGYSTSDFKASVNYYLEDPAQYSKMLKNVALTLESKAAKLKGEQKEPEIEISEKHE